MHNKNVGIKTYPTNEFPKKGYSVKNRHYGSTFAIVTSVTALIVSSVTLYLNFLSPADLRIAGGDRVNIHHYKEGNLGISMPMSISNLGSKFVNVERLALLIKKTDSKEGYLLEPHSYQRLDNNSIVGESLSAPIPVAGRTSLVKDVLFRSSPERTLEFNIEKPGTYELTLLSWVGDSVKPRAIDSSSIVLDDGHIRSLHENLQKSSSMTLRLPLSKWKPWSAHPLTEVEINLLQQK